VEMPSPAVAEESVIVRPEIRDVITRQKGEFKKDDTPSDCGKHA